MFNLFNSNEIPDSANALPGRAEPIDTAEHHFINGHALKAPYPEGMEIIYFGMGCFWGAERLFWQLPGVHVTAVGYQAGATPNPDYREVCSGKTGHAETVMVVYDPAQISTGALLKSFWEEHDPTQGMRQGNDVGTQYRSGIYVTNDAQRQVAEETRKTVAQQLTAKGLGPITTEIMDAPPFYFAEADHQQYLAKNPAGYCGLKGTGVSCPV